MDITQIKWYSILASFFVALIESIIIILFFCYFFDIQSSLMLHYADIYVPILFFINLRTSKRLGEHIVFDQLPVIKTARKSLSSTITRSHLLSINIYAISSFISETTLKESLSHVDDLFYAFVILNFVCFIAIPIGSILLNQIFGFVLGKIIERFKP